MNNILAARNGLNCGPLDYEAEERGNRQREEAGWEGYRLSRLLLLVFAVPAISSSLFISVQTVAQPVRQSTETDQCSSPRFQVETIEGFRTRVLPGTNSALLPVNSSIKWFCDHVQEKTRCPSNTNFAVFRRDPPNSRRVTVDCISNRQVDHDLATDVSHPSIHPYRRGGLWTRAGFNGATWYVGDFDGDGSDDLLRQINKWGGGDVLLSNGHNGFSAPQRWTGAGFNQATWYVGDFDGDGNDDLLRQINKWGGGDVLLSNGHNGFYAPQRWTSAGFYGATWYVGDFDGNGRDDLLRQINKWGGGDVLLSNGHNGFSAPQRWTSAGFYGATWYVGDFNGDGSDDLLRHSRPHGGADVLLSRGNNFGPPRRWTNSDFNFYGWIVTDFNGDGRDDLVGVTKDGFLKTFRSTGNRFYGYFVADSVLWHSSYLGYNLIYSADINGDDRDDLLYQINKWGGAEALISDDF